MKTIYYIISAAIILFSVCNSYSQWEPETLLETSIVSYSSASPSIDANNNNLHIVWLCNNHTTNNANVLYKRSTDGGITWGSATQINTGTDTTLNCISTNISVSGSYVHVIWIRQIDDFNDEVYYRRSTNGGIAWDPVTRLTYLGGWHHYPPKIVTSGQSVHIVFYNETASCGLYYIRSTNRGATWEAPVNLFNHVPLWSNTSIAVSGDDVHITWNYRDLNNADAEIYYKHSGDLGLTWDADIRLTNHPGESYDPVISASGRYIHVCWWDQRHNDPGEIYYKRSTDKGITWEAVNRLTQDTGTSISPSMTISGSIVHIAYSRLSAEGNYEIFYKRSTDKGFTWEASERLTNTAYYSINPKIISIGNNVKVFWEDRFNYCTYQLYLKNNPTGNTFGKPHANIENTETPSEFSLSQNYPNPFNPNTNIGFQIAGSGFVSLKVYDIMGKEAAVLVNENLIAGSYNINFDASGLASGMYFYKLTSGEFTDTKKLILVK